MPINIAANAAVVIDYDGFNSCVLGFCMGARVGPFEHSFLGAFKKSIFGSDIKPMVSPLRVLYNGRMFFEVQW